jgi:hypothetical protein
MNTATNLLHLTTIDGLNAMLAANHVADAADLAKAQIAAFRAQTGKRKFSVPFAEEGETWIIDAQGHQWLWSNEYGEGFAWECMTDEDDSFVIETKRAKRAA